MNHPILNTVDNVQDYGIQSDVTKIDSIIKESTLQMQMQVEYDSQISAKTAEDLMNQLCQVTLEALEKIKNYDDNLKNDEQRQLYEVLSSRQSADSSNLEGILEAVAYLPELVQRMSILFRSILTRNSADADSYIILTNLCNDRIKGYMSSVIGLFRFLTKVVQPDFIPLASDLLMGSISGLSCRMNETVDKEIASLMLTAAELAYNCFETFNTDLIKNFMPISSNTLDPTLTPYYNEDRGIFEMDSGLRAWLGCNASNKEAIVAFSGTDIKNFQMVYADYMQLNAESVLYGYAVGLLNMICQSLPDYTIYVCGHSLGGGLAAFSSCACATPNRNIYCYTFNTACLSFTSLNYLGIDCMKKQMDKTFHFRTVSDPVSEFGGLYGTVTVLPKSNSNGHSLSCVKECFGLYINT